MSDQPEPFEVGEVVDVLLTVEVRSTAVVVNVNDDGTVEVNVDATAIQRSEATNVVGIMVMRRATSPDGQGL